MRIEDAKGVPISSLDDWAGIYSSPRSAHQWKEHRSAFSVAKFILNRNGGDCIRARVSDAIGQQVEFQKAIPEFEVRFDEFGRGRVHDLAMFGKSNSGRSLFVGVEAKVDEPFGPTAREAYLAAKAKQIAGESTKAPDRIEGLLKMHFADTDPGMFDVRYQLLYATAGTLAAGADISLLYVIVFKTPLYSETKGAENYRDYVDFLGKASAKKLTLSDKAIVGHKLSLAGKELFCLHEYFDL